MPIAIRHIVVFVCCAILEFGRESISKTRRLLEKAGAKTDLEQAKQFWQDTCRLQDERTPTTVQKSNDLLETVLAEGAETLARFLAEQQFKKE